MGGNPGLETTVEPGRSDDEANKTETVMMKRQTHHVDLGNGETGDPRRPITQNRSCGFFSTYARTRTAVNKISLSPPDLPSPFTSTFLSLELYQSFPLCLLTTPTDIATQRGKEHPTGVTILHLRRFGLLLVLLLGGRGSRKSGADFTGLWH